MTRSLLLLSCLALASTACRKGPGDDTGAETDPVEVQVQAWLDAMSLEQKVAEMHGAGGAPTGGLWRSGGNPELGIPAFAMSDGPRGVTAGVSTTFPVGMARGATWDPELERRVGVAIATELQAKGGNVILAPVVETLRHPAWGRAQETYGEDPLHLGAMGVGFVLGAQSVGVIATPKHFAVNHIEDTRFDVDMTVPERALRELYLRPHHDVVKARAGAIMSAYNSVNGAFCAENEVLLRDILKEEWGYEGFVMSDWIWGTHDTVGAATAGLDIEMPAPQHFGPALVEAVQGGQVDEALIDEAVGRILRAKLRFGLDEPPAVDPSVVESAAHVALAHEVALASMVLLRNEGNALPLGPGSIAVIGPLADVANLGDEGSSNATPSSAVTPLQGIQAAAGRVGASVNPVTDPAQTASADAAVVVVGLTSEDEGEQIPLFPGGDRDDLGLKPSDVQLIRDVAAYNPRTIVVLEGGSAIRVSEWVDEVAGLVMAWYPGMEGGTALGELLFGEADFEGHLPLSIPVNDADLPDFDHTSTAVTVDDFHGYRHLDREGIAAQYPLGFGLSYTGFTQTEPVVSADGQGLRATVTVTNTGTRAGADLVLLWGATGLPDRAPRELLAFAKVRLDPGQSETVTLSVPADRLQIWDGGWTDTDWTVPAP